MLPGWGPFRAEVATGDSVATPWECAVSDCAGVVCE